jgi:hypothetical protein
MKNLFFTLKSKEDMLGAGIRAFGEAHMYGNPLTFYFRHPECLRYWRNIKFHRTPMFHNEIIECKPLDMSKLRSRGVPYDGLVPPVPK